MLTSEQRDNLATHAIGMIHSVILPEITPQGCVLVKDPDGTVRQDPVATQHLIDLCLELSPSLTRSVVADACSWFVKNAYSTQDPFLLTSLARAKRLGDADARTVVHELILPNQRPSGAVDLYAGFLDGGSIFSTLWAIRLLQILGSDSDAVNPAILRAFGYLDSHWDDIHRTSFKGFYCELRWAGGDIPSTGSRSGKVLSEIVAAQSVEGLWDDNNPLYSAYILGNLCSIPTSPPEDVLEALDRGFLALFGLESPPKGLPPHFVVAKSKYVESAYLQLCIRASIAAIRYLRRFHEIDVAAPVAASIMGSYSDIYHTARALGARLKQMNDQYGHIQVQFSHLDGFANKILAESPYEKNVFVMMPFRQDRDERYEKIEQIIRVGLKDAGLHAWLASDKSLAPQLWDNVTSFLVACKYGIAVFTRIEKEHRIDEEFNPNVSLELGFCLSRGKRVLILKDTALCPLQTDLVGHLYKEFDLNQVGRQLPQIITNWVQETVAMERKTATSDD